MCHPTCIQFIERFVRSDEIRGRDVLEVGAQDVNGSPRPVIEGYKPHVYRGVDLTPGPGVDLVCSVYDLDKRFGKESFDVVISTEMLEHVRDWRRAVMNMDAVLKPGGWLYLTTRSEGFGYHGYPYDYWRFGIEDLKAIYSNYQIMVSEPDSMLPGVFLKARKRNDPLNIPKVMNLHCMLTENRRETISAMDILIFKIRYLYSHNRQYLPRWIKSILHGIYDRYRHNRE